jgi:hypothetical protein
VAPADHHACQDSLILFNDYIIALPICISTSMELRSYFHNTLLSLEFMRPIG